MLKLYHPAPSEKETMQAYSFQWVTPERQILRHVARFDNSAEAEEFARQVGLLYARRTEDGYCCWAFAASGMSGDWSFDWVLGSGLAVTHVKSK